MKPAHIPNEEIKLDNSNNRFAHAYYGIHVDSLKLSVYPVNFEDNNGNLIAPWEHELSALIRLPNEPTTRLIKFRFHLKNKIEDHEYEGIDIIGKFLTPHIRKLKLLPPNDSTPD